MNCWRLLMIFDYGNSATAFTLVESICILLLEMIRPRYLALDLKKLHFSSVSHKLCLLRSLRTSGIACLWLNLCCMSAIISSRYSAISFPILSSRMSCIASPFGERFGWYVSDTTHLYNRWGEWPSLSTWPPFTNCNKFINIILTTTLVTYPKEKCSNSQRRGFYALSKSYDELKESIIMNPERFIKEQWWTQGKDYNDTQDLVNLLWL